MFKITIKLVCIFFILDLTKDQVFSAPINEDNYMDYYNPGDYVRDSDLEAVIARLARTTQGSNVNHQNVNEITTKSTLDDGNLNIITYENDSRDTIDNVQSMTQSTISGHIVNDNNIVLNKDMPPSQSTATSVDKIEECPICIEPLNTKDQDETKCKHKFHKDCLKTWCDKVSY